MTTNRSNKNYSFISVIRVLLLLTLSFSAVVSCGGADDSATPTSLAEKPGAPTSVTDAIIDNVDNSISLNWSAPTNSGKNSTGKTASITGYKVEYSNEGAEGWVELTTNRTGFRLSAPITSNSTSVRIIGLTPGTTYYFRLSAINEAGVGLTSAVKVVRFYPTPKNVTSITVSPQTVNLALSSKATLTFSYLPANATNANVTWSSGETGVATVSGNNSTATVTAVGGGVATITVNAGGISKSVTVKVTPASPANFQQTAISTTTADLKWQSSSGIGINYKIYQVRDDKTTVLLSTITRTTYKATGLTENTFYTYEVKACADNTDTACSGLVSLKILTSSSSSAKNLAAIIADGKIPDNLNTYDESSQDIFAGHKASTVVVARYVLPGGAGNKSGTNWANAAANPKTVLDGIGDASSTKIYAVLLGPGVYKAGASMAMKNYVTMAGGISTLNTIPANAVTGSTVLSGNNSYQVFSNDNIDNTARLYGVTIADGNSSAHGGGMYNNSSYTILTKVVFSNNTANNDGGGMYNDNSSLALNKVIFSGNTANYGGGMYNDNSSLALNKAIFSGNTARFNGGGIHSVNASKSFLTGVVFSGNTAAQAGGAINMNNNNMGIIYIVNSIFWGNRVGGKVENITLYNDNASGQETFSLYNSIVEGGMPAGYASGTTVTDFNGGGFTSSGGTGNIVVNFSSIISIDPGLGPLTDNGGGINTMKIQAGSSAVNNGLYVRERNNNQYYSIDQTKWYLNNPALTGNEVTLPTTMNLTAADMTGYTVNGRPDIGVYEAR